MPRRSRWLAVPVSLLLPVFIALLAWWSPSEVTLDIGGYQDTQYIQNFFDRERTESTTGRWTEPVATLVLPTPNWPALLTLQLAVSPSVSSAHLVIPRGVLALLAPKRDDRPQFHEVRTVHVLLVPGHAWDARASIAFVTPAASASPSDSRQLGMLVRSTSLSSITRPWLWPPLSPLLALMLITGSCWLGLWLISSVLTASGGATLIGGILAWAWGWHRLWVDPYLWPLGIGLLWLVGVLLLARFRWRDTLPISALFSLLLVESLGLVLWEFYRYDWVGLWTWRGLPLLIVPLAVLLLMIGQMHTARLIGLIIVILLVFGVQSYASLWARDWASDFAPLFRGPRAIWRGEQLYQISDLRANPLGAVYKYPPFFTFVMGPFTLLSPGIAFQTWKAVQVILVLLAAWMIWRAEGGVWQRWSTVWLLALLAFFQPIIDTIRYGQVDALILVLLAGGLWAIRRNHWWLFGVLLAVATLIKLYPAYLLLLVLIRGRKEGLYGFTGGLIILGAISVLVLGPDVHLTYLTEVLPRSGGGTAWVENQTINGFVARLSITSVLSLVPVDGAFVTGATYVAFAFVTLLASWWSMAWSDDRAYSLLIVAMLIVLPVSWIHYHTVLLIPLYVVFAHLEQAERLEWSRVVPLALACALLCFGNQWTFFDRTLHGPFWQLVLSYKLYGLLLLLLAIGLPARSRRHGDLRIEAPSVSHLETA